MINYTLSPKIFVKLSLPNAKHLTSVSALTEAPLVLLSYNAYSPKLSFGPIKLICFLPLYTPT